MNVQISKSQRKLLIYNDDVAIRKAYATYLQRNGIQADSCGTAWELERLLSWYEYEFILINIDSLTQNPTQSDLKSLLSEIIHQHQIDPILIATSSHPDSENEFEEFSWFLQEPLTPKGILTTISKIRQQYPETHLKLRKSLSKPIEFD